MAEKLPSVTSSTDLSLPYNLNQGEAEVKKKDHHIKIQGGHQSRHRMFVVQRGQWAV